MRRLRIAVIAAVSSVAFTLIASAADMSVKAPRFAPPPVPIVFSWTGPYIGATAGWGWGESHQCGPGACSATYDIDGGIAGGTIGYNWQVNNWVAGLEADISWADINGVGGDGPLFGCGTGCQTKVKWFGTARLRFGPSFDRFLPYVTGGIAFAGLEGALGAFSASATKTGWTVGGGLEYGFTANWSGKIEYLFIDGLGTFSTPTICGPVACTVEDTRFSVVRAGLNYRF
jgi:outer membrane immunogenic protein